MNRKCIKLENEEVLLTNKIKVLSLYGYFKNGTIFKLNRVYFKFVAYTYDTVNGKEEILYVLYNMNQEEYVIKREKELENRIASIMKLNTNTKC